MQSFQQRQKKPARQLRSNLTDAEQVLWKRLRWKQIRNDQFYRQKPLINFIVDFYCSKAQLVIELDGG
jgi:very-short-patch-repair endonuclease